MAIRFVAPSTTAPLLFSIARGKVRHGDRDIPRWPHHRVQSRGDWPPAQMKKCISRTTAPPSCASTRTPLPAPIPCPHQAAGQDHRRQQSHAAQDPGRRGAHRGRGRLLPHPVLLAHRQSSPSRAPRHCSGARRIRAISTFRGGPDFIKGNEKNGMRLHRLRSNRSLLGKVSCAGGTGRLPEVPRPVHSDGSGRRPLAQRRAGPFRPEPQQRAGGPQPRRQHHHRH